MKEVTERDIINLAHKHMLLDDQHYRSRWLERVLSFATEVQEMEREACAQICDHEMDNAMNLGMNVAAGNCADKIRARGEK